VYEISILEPGWGKIRIKDPVWGKIRIRDEEKSGSGIRIRNTAQKEEVLGVLQVLDRLEDIADSLLCRY